MLPQVTAGISMELTLGNILTIAAIIGGWCSVLLMFKGKIDLLVQSFLSIDKRLTSLEDVVVTFNSTLITIAKQEVRLDSHAERIHSLEYWKEGRPRPSK